MQTKGIGWLFAHGLSADVVGIVLEPRIVREQRAIVVRFVGALAAADQRQLPREVDRVARAIIEEGDYGDNFGHGLGHGVGLDVHEAPRLSRHGDTALEAGMIVTVEPGIYVAGECGVRIEDLLLVTADHSEALNGLPKERQLVS